MDATNRTTDEIVSLLAAGPARLAALAAGATAEQLVTPPAPGEWSPRDVLAHLRACGDMWGQSIGRILREDHPTFKAVNPTTWLKQTDYPALAFHPSLAAFAAQRAALVAVLRPRPPEGWQRAATVTVAGKPLERTVFTYAQWLAHHERPHIKQIARAVAAAIP